MSGQGAGLGRAEHNPHLSRKRPVMKGQKGFTAYWVVCGKEVLLRTRDVTAARAFQNGLGFTDAKVIAVRVVWKRPRAVA